MVVTGAGSLRDRLAAGERLDLLAGSDIEDGVALPESVMRSWGSDHELSADDLCAVLQGGGLTDLAIPRPRDLVLRGIRVTGRLMLDFATDVRPLHLRDCLLDEGISAYAAHLPCLKLERCRISHPSMTPLQVAGARFDDDLLLDRCVVTAPPGAHHAVDLMDATIGHALRCPGTVLINGSGPALAADGCEVRCGINLAGGFRARGAGRSGAVGLLGARIIGALNADGATLINRSGPALAAARCEVSGGVYFTGGFRALGAGDFGAIGLLGARITGALSVDGATLINRSGPALTADRCEVSSGLYLTGRFRALGAGESGAIGLLGAQITGALNADDATLINKSGSALIADQCQIAGSVLLTGKFRACGGGDTGAVRLPGARITGEFNAEGSGMTSLASTALDLGGAQVVGSVLLTGGFRAHGAGAAAAVALTGARFGPLRVEDGGVTHAAGPQRRWNVDDCTYAGLPRPDDRKRWVKLLRYGTPAYAAQPYQQLASVHRAAGHDPDVRAILIAQRQDQVARGRLSWPERVWVRFTGGVLGYGWKPWRAIYWLLGIFAASALLASCLGGQGALIHPPQPNRPVEACTVIERIGVGLDLGTPLVGSATKPRERCPINPDPTSATATAFIVSTWVLQVLAWGFAALFVAGFTGAVRKT